MSKKCKNHCENCNYFDNAKMKLDDRTKTAGVCKKWYDVVFQKTPSCKEFIDDKIINDIFVEKPIVQNYQYNLFK
jgi:hypothetical protein